VPVFEEAQLLQPFQLLQLPGREARIEVQGRGGIGVEPEMVGDRDPVVAFQAAGEGDYFLQK